MRTLSKIISLALAFAVISSCGQGKTTESQATSSTQSTMIEQTTPNPENAALVQQFLKKVGTYYLATVEGDQPRVRPFGTAEIFEGKLYIQTGKVKNVYKQLIANPKAEICGINGVSSANSSPMRGLRQSRTCLTRTPLSRASTKLTTTTLSSSTCATLRLRFHRSPPNPKYTSSSISESIP